MQKRTLNPYGFKTENWSKWLAGFTSWTPTVDPAEPDNVAFMEGFRAAAESNAARNEALAVS
ncbi:hypothetical protein HY971_04225 [Candidatus Kaiserbacteria bacterium]|nr:hypothetical protein [Candidatus Kaiserbacteria bacterium]